MKEESISLPGIRAGVYDLVGLLVPGVLLICEGWISVRGWARFTATVGHLDGVSFALLIIASFLLGHFVQEFGHASLNILCGPRLLKEGRDTLWKEPEADAVKSVIWTESGITLGDVDAAFDYCLTRVGDSFSRRDVFLATADLSRALLVLAVLGVAPACRLAHDRSHSTHGFVLTVVCYCILLGLAAGLAWIRMIRFRRFSDYGVFRSYLGSRPMKNLAADRSGETDE